MRVFIPVGAEDLAVLAAHHRLPGPVTAYAFTDAMRAAWPEADQEEGEYAALMTAARRLDACTRGPVGGSLRRTCPRSPRGRGTTRPASRC